MLSPQQDLIYNVGGAVNTLTQTDTTRALVLLVNVTRPSLQYTVLQKTDQMFCTFALF